MALVTAVLQVRSLAWELSCAVGAAKKKSKHRAISGLEKKASFKKCCVKSLKLTFESRSKADTGDLVLLRLCLRDWVSLPGMCLGELVINPHQQHMDAFYWVIDWEGMISVSSLVGLLEKHFFPKWLQVRC